MNVDVSITEYIADRATAVLAVRKYPEDVASLLRKLDATVERMRTVHELP